MVYHVIGNDEFSGQYRVGAPVCILLAYYKVVYETIRLVIFEGIARFFCYGQYNW